jgi:hypothetical protein
MGFVSKKNVAANAHLRRRTLDPPPFVDELNTSFLEGGACLLKNPQPPARRREHTAAFYAIEEGSRPQPPNRGSFTSLCPTA